MKRHDVETGELRAAGPGRDARWAVDEAAGRSSASTSRPASGADLSARRSSQRVAARRRGMALIAGALALGAAWVIYHPVEAARLPPAAERLYPAPGFEEEPSALGIVPPAPATDAPYAFTRTDGATIPVSWSPCRPIHYVVAGEGAPAGFHDQVIAVIAEVSAATGLKFVDDGASVEAPDFDRLPFQPTVYGDRWAPVLIEFADETTIKRLSGPVLGVTKVTHTRDATTGVSHLVSGAVYLDTEILPRPNAHGHPAYVPVLRHELGHLVGLKHVVDVTQVMNATLTDLTAYQPGDLVGLVSCASSSS